MKLHKMVDGVKVDLTAEEVADFERREKEHQEYLDSIAYKQSLETAKRVYPSIQQQLDMQYWDAVNGTTLWLDTIKAIKDKHPKQ